MNILDSVNAVELESIRWTVVKALTRNGLQDADAQDVVQHALVLMMCGEWKQTDTLTSALLTSYALGVVNNRGRAEQVRANYRSSNGGVQVEAEQVADQAGERVGDQLDHLEAKETDALLLLTDNDLWHEMECCECPNCERPLRGSTATRLCSSCKRRHRHAQESRRRRLKEYLGEHSLDRGVFGLFRRPVPEGFSICRTIDRASAIGSQPVEVVPAPPGPYRIMLSTIEVTGIPEGQFDVFEGASPMCSGWSASGEHDFASYAAMPNTAIVVRVHARAGPTSEVHVRATGSYMIPACSTRERDEKGKLKGPKMLRRGKKHAELDWVKPSPTGRRLWSPSS